MTTSRTAEYVALYRALETTEMRREPVFRDPFAVRFLPPRLTRVLDLARIRPLRAALERYADWRAPGARTSAIARTRYIDDAVRGAVADGARQLVVLGAGYDCRAHRLAELRDVAVFEVDRAATQDAKRSRIAGAAGARGDIRYVAVDFAIDDLGARLAEAGWDSRVRSIVLWEGVTNYLTEPDVTRVLGMIGGTAAGTRLVFTYIHRGVIDGTTQFAGGAKLVHNVRALGEPWRFGLRPDEVAAFIGRYGLVLDENLGADDYRRRYLDGDLHGYAFYRIASAHVA
jgi:methyltransferase (TIGR00027 family)